MSTTTQQHKITLGLTNGVEQVELICENYEVAKLKFDFIIEEQFTAAVTISIVDNNGQVIETLNKPTAQ